MTVVIYILGIVGLLIALVFIIAIFVKKSYGIKRSVVINKPKQQIFNYVKLIKNSEHFSKWVMLDPNSRRQTTGIDGMAGFVYAWDSDIKKVGKGEQEIKSVIEGERIDYEIRFIKPFEGKADSSLITESVSDASTKVTWTFGSAMKYPMNIMMLFMDFEKMLGKDMEESLRNLKVLLEKNN